MKKELLGPVGHIAVDYLRRRLKRRMEMDVQTLLLRRRDALRIMRCMDERTTVKHVEELIDQATETKSPEFLEELTRLLREVHGSARYVANPELLKKDLLQAIGLYRFYHAFDAIFAECGYPQPRTAAERMDDAAWYAPRGSDDPGRN